MRFWRRFSTTLLFVSSILIPLLAATETTPTLYSSMKPRVLIVGFGDLGERVYPLIRDDFQVVGLRRDPSKLPQGVFGLPADYTDPAALLAALRSQPPFRYVVVTQSPTGGFHEQSYRKHFPQATRHLLEALAQQTPPVRRILYASSISVYDLSDQPITEQITPVPPRFNGQAILEAERILQESTIPTTVMRLAGLYGGTADGDGPNLDGSPPRFADHPLARMAASSMQTNKPLSPLFAPQGGPSKIHRDDAAAALTHVLRRCEAGSSIKDCYLVADAAPAANEKVARWIYERAAAQGVKVPGLFEKYLKEGGKVLLPGKRCDSSLIRSEGFELKYRSFQDGYEQVYSGK